MRQGMADGLIVGAFLLGYLALATILVSGIVWAVNRLGRRKHPLRRGVKDGRAGRGHRRLAGLYAARARGKTP